MTPPVIWGQTGNDALRAAIYDLRGAGIDDAPRDARLLLAHAMGVPANRLTLHLADDLAKDALFAFQGAVAARVRHQPIAQITGQRQFWRHSFKVTRDTLDPRPETEVLVAAALERPFVNLLDLGTGTGCVLLSCLADMPMAQGLGVDISDAALDVARANAVALGLQGRTRFAPSDWFSKVSGRYDLIVSNPPYIAAIEMMQLSPDVRNWEPHLALTPGGDGLDAYRKIAAGAPARLMPGGRLMVEIGPTQGAAVSALFVAQGLQAIRILPDLDQRDRVVMAQKAQLSP